MARRQRPPPPSPGHRLDQRPDRRPPRRRCPRRATAHNVAHRAANVVVPGERTTRNREDPSRADPPRQGASKPRRRRQQPGRARPCPMAAARGGRRGGGRRWLSRVSPVATQRREEETGDLSRSTDCLVI